MKWKWDTDRIVSLSAMVVGVGSLVIILYQTKLMREQQRASVMFITYSSVYGEKWHLRSDSFVPVPGPAPGSGQ